jgi:hypothetical protein
MDPIQNIIQELSLKAVEQLDLLMLTDAYKAMAERDLPIERIAYTGTPHTGIAMVILDENGEPQELAGPWRKIEWSNEFNPATQSMIMKVTVRRC